jgi:hypothetical protein
MKLKALRAHYLDGTVQAVGSVYEAPDKLARALIHAGKAVAAPEDPPAKAKPAKAKTMTVAASPELVAGAVEPEKESQP